MSVVLTPQDGLTPFAEAGVLDPLAVQFARTLARLDPSADVSVLLGAAAASSAVARGHVCCDLRRAARLLAPREEAASDAVAALPWPAPEAWQAALADSALVSSDGGERAPLVLDGPRIYLHRYWEYERRLAQTLAARASALADDVDPQALTATLDRLFPAAATVAAPDDQRVAAERAVMRRLAIITGGPGTGKTSTVVRVLAALLEQDAALRVALVAPTGKAAARMSEAIRDARADHVRLDVSEAVRALIPEEASTIHRILKRQPGNATRFQFDATRPLPADVVVVDEASMVDLALMTKLVEAVRPDARLILLGDKDQLASVEAGNVLGELCAAPGLADSRVELTVSHRFGPDSGIAAVARAINDGDADTALKWLLDPERTDVVLVQPPADGDLDSVVRPLVAAPLAQVMAERVDPSAALAALGAFQLLAAHRRGRWGASALNEAVERWLAEDGVVTPGELAYEGRRVMITTNDYQLSLFNGDTGVVLRDPADGRLRVWFHDLRDGGVRKLIAAQLPPHDTFYATTVHKGQGSGYDRVVVVLPPEPTPILTRELLYTAVTRARSQVTLVGSEAVVRHAVATPVERASGLNARVSAGG